MTCEKCVFFELETDPFFEIDFGYCNSPKTIEKEDLWLFHGNAKISAFYKGDVKDDCMLLGGAWGSSVTHRVGRLFGCVHFTAR